MTEKTQDLYTSTPCPDGFSLGATLLSGQCFRWEEHGGVYSGAAFGRAVTLTQSCGEILIKGDSDAAFWRRYLDLDTDYDAIRREIVMLEPRLEESAAACGEVRILRQEPWEALCSFVISQNNNIGRIRLIIKRLCGGSGQNPFPMPSEVASLSEDELAEMGCGYRGPYILAAARAVSSGELDLELLRELPLEEARSALTAIHGIGPKVADCALLYGLHRLECFPRDVWIKRALSQGLVSEKVAASRYAGVAQQFVFEYIRNR